MNNGDTRMDLIRDAKSGHHIDEAYIQQRIAIEKQHGDTHDGVMAMTLDEKLAEIAAMDAENARLGIGAGKGDQRKEAQASRQARMDAQWDRIMRQASS